MTSVPRSYAPAAMEPRVGPAAGGDVVGLRGLPAFWLRSNCRCPDCLDPGSSQQLVGITDQPADVWAAPVRVAAGDVEVVFGPDGHQAVFARRWLAGHEGQPDGGQEGRRRATGTCRAATQTSTVLPRRSRCSAAPL